VKEKKKEEKKRKREKEKKKKKKRKMKNLPESKRIVISKGHQIYQVLSIE